MICGVQSHRIHFTPCGDNLDRRRSGTSKRPVSFKSEHQLNSQLPTNGKNAATGGAAAEEAEAHTTISVQFTLHHAHSTLSEIHTTLYALYRWGQSTHWTHWRAVGRRCDSSEGRTKTEPTPTTSGTAKPPSATDNGMECVSEGYALLISNKTEFLKHQILQTLPNQPRGLVL